MAGSARSRQRTSFSIASTPSVRSIVRVVLVTLVILFVFDFAEVDSRIAHVSFLLIVLSIFFAYLIEPLVKMIRRPFEEAKRENICRARWRLRSAYLFVFTTLGIADRLY